HDYLAYAPEAAAPVHLIWVAVHRRNAHFSSLSELSYEQLMRDELGDTTLEQFTAQLVNKGLAVEEYILMPV
ncbi:IucA/IucC family protein, partial [Bacillus subtilis]